MRALARSLRSLDTALPTLHSLTLVTLRHRRTFLAPLDRCYRCGGFQPPTPPVSYRLTNKHANNVYFAPFCGYNIQ
nr:MAG TPA: hypothetical protein [Microviridae sp.]